MACRHLLMRNFRTNYTTNLWSGTCGTLLSTALLISCSYPWRSPPDSAQSLLGLSESSLVLPRVAVCFRYVLCCAALFVICVHEVGSLCRFSRWIKKNWVKKFRCACTSTCLSLVLSALCKKIKKLVSVMLTHTPVCAPAALVLCVPGSFALCDHCLSHV